MSKKHALLGASSSARWLICTPSARLEAQFPDEQSPYAAEGTIAHDLAESILRHKLESAKAPTEGDHSNEMVEAVGKYVDICEEKVNEAKARSVDAEILIEARLDFSRWVPEGFGTGDMVIVSDGVLEVIDLKFGKGVPVSAVGNTQMRLYALGAYDWFELLYDVHTVRMTIVQPRLLKNYLSRNYSHGVMRLSLKRRQHGKVAENAPHVIIVIFARLGTNAGH